MGKINGNNGIETSIEEFRKVIKEAEEEIKYWREINGIKIENFGKEWTKLQKCRIEICEKELNMLIVEKRIMERIDLTISAGEQVLEQLQLPLRIQCGNIFTNKKEAIKILDGAIEYMIEVRNIANNDLTNGDGDSYEQFRNFIKGKGDFFQNDIVENFFKCLKN